MHHSANTKRNKLYREEVEQLGEVFFTDAKGHSGYTPLILAAGFNLIEVVDYLLNYKVPIDDRLTYIQLDLLMAS